MVKVDQPYLSTRQIKQQIKHYEGKELRRLPRVRPWLGSICYLPEDAGVYLLASSSDEVLYVGSSVDLKNRLCHGMHEGFSKVVSLCGSDFWIYWLPCKPKTSIVAKDPRLLALEQSYIDLYKPKLNVHPAFIWEAEKSGELPPEKPGENDND